jgi:pimeloyl-ACP methyl ester carboxylesterase
MKSMMAVFEGKMREDSLTIDGQWKQGGQTLPLTLKRVDEVPELRRPQEPKRPYPYKEEEVIYENKKAAVKLAGTLTLPPSDGPFPAVLLISGSGMQDRNETVFGHRPFLVLADYLTRQGLAVLRVDDRGVGGSTGSMALFLQSTSEDFAHDVLAGIDYLKTRSEIDPKRIGLIGHSEGGIIAPMVAAQSPDVAFIVLMAGTGLDGQEVLYLQSDLILKAVGASHEVRAIQRAALEETFNILKHEEGDATAETKIRNLMKDTLAKLSKDEKEALGLSEGMLELQIKMALSPWFGFFLTYDPKPTLMKVKCPVLAIIGEKDLQVAPKENLRAIEQALKAGGNEHYTVKELPNLNHLFQTAQTGSLTEYAKIEETISPAALKLIGDWINKL